MRTRKYKKTNQAHKPNKYYMKSKKRNFIKKKLRGGVEQSKICGLDKVFIDKLFTQDISPLKALGLNIGSTKDQIKKQYHKLLLKIHPDKCDDQRATEIFEKIKDLYDILMLDMNESPYLSSPQPTTSNKTTNKEKYASLTDIIVNIVESIKDIRFNNLKAIYLPHYLSASSNTLLFKLLKKSANRKLSIENIDQENNKVASIKTNLESLKKRLSDNSMKLNLPDMIEYEKYLYNRSLYNQADNWILESIRWSKIHIKDLSEQIEQALEIVNKIENNLQKTKQKLLDRSSLPRQSSIRKFSVTLDGSRKRTAKIISDRLSSLTSSRLFSPRSSRQVRIGESSQRY